MREAPVHDETEGGSAEPPISSAPPAQTPLHPDAVFTAEQLEDRTTTDERSLGEAHEDLPDVAQEVVQTEGSAEHESSARAEDSTIAIWLFDKTGEARPVSLNDVCSLIRDDANFVWIDLSSYQPHELRAVAELLGLADVAVHMALSAWQRPRMESFKDHYFATATVARIDPTAYQVHASQLDLFVGHNYLVSTHKLPLPFAEHIMQRAQHNPELVRLDSSFMLYIVLDELLGHFDYLSEHVQSEIERTEERALSETSETFLRDLLRLKRYIFALQQLAEQHRQVFETLLRPDFSFINGPEISIYFRDLEARLVRLRSDLAGERESINGAFDIYVSHVSHRTNHAIKVLTVMSAILFSITAIVGIFGTSFKTAGFLYGTGGFVTMVCAVVLVTVGLLAAFRYKGWV